MHFTAGDVHSKLTDQATVLQYKPDSYEPTDQAETLYQLHVLYSTLFSLFPSNMGAGVGPLKRF